MECWHIRCANGSFTCNSILSASSLVGSPEGADVLEWFIGTSVLCGPRRRRRRTRYWCCLLFFPGKCHMQRDGKGADSLGPWPGKGWSARSPGGLSFFIRALFYFRLSLSMGIARKKFLSFFLRESTEKKGTGKNFIADIHRWHVPQLFHSSPQPPLLSYNRNVSGMADEFFHLFFPFTDWIFSNFVSVPAADLFYFTYLFFLFLLNWFSELVQLSGPVPLRPPKTRDYASWVIHRADGGHYVLLYFE